MGEIITRVTIQPVETEGEAWIVHAYPAEMVTYSR